jgi:hypothetical protein
MQGLKADSENTIVQNNNNNYSFFYQKKHFFCVAPSGVL